MEFKGISWVGNVYQKFEAMCLEVEEIIVQDTAKYVENQVQTVGNTVKKFYSDVVQDFVSEDGSGKPLPVSMLNDYAPVCSFEKKREIINRKTRVVNVKQEEEVSEMKKDGCAVEFRGLDADDYDICTSPRRYSYGGPYRRKRIGRKQREELIQITKPCIQTDASTNIALDHSSRVKDDVGAVKSSDSLPGEVDRTEKRHGLKDVNSVIRSQDSETRNENEHDLTVVSSVRSQDSKIRTEDEHGLKVVNSVRNQDSEIQTSVATSLLAGSDDCRKETEEDSTQTSSSSASYHQKSEILEQINGKSVEESCIIVDRDEFYCVLPDKKENNKHKPYKKIKDAISSRMKQNREREYKRLALRWYAEDVENGRGCGDNLAPVEENRSSEEESEWELL